MSATDPDTLRPIIAAAAEAAAERTMSRTFRLLGVDMADQDSINEFRADLVYARKIRRMSDRAGIAAMKTVIGFVVVALLVWLGSELAAAWKGVSPG